MKVELSDQVLAFVRSQAPQPRRRLRRALRELAFERGNSTPLEGPLSPYQRLRVGPYRVIFVRESPTGQPPRIRCLFADRRSTVYTVFSEMLKRDIME